jgi:putative membrane protein
MEIALVLPTVNAALNATSGVLLTAGFAAIRARRIELHRRLMLSAFASSTIFLVCYLIRVGLTGTHRYPGTGASQVVYLAILVSHMLLAVAVVPLALRTLHLSLFKREFDAHRRIGRVTLPVWLYVSVTGVVVYLMLYHFAS